MRFDYREIGDEEAGGGKMERYYEFRKQGKLGRGLETRLLFALLKCSIVKRRWFDEFDRFSGIRRHFQGAGRTP